MAASSLLKSASVALAAVAMSSQNASGPDSGTCQRARKAIIKPIALTRSCVVGVPSFAGSQKWQAASFAVIHSSSLRVVTGRSGEAERVRGLSVGADDYVIKPFSMPELMARIRGLLRACPRK